MRIKPAVATVVVLRRVLDHAAGCRDDGGPLELRHLLVELAAVAELDATGHDVSVPHVDGHVLLMLVGLEDGHAEPLDELLAPPGNRRPRGSACIGDEDADRDVLADGLDRVALLLRGEMRLFPRAHLVQRRVVRMPGPQYERERVGVIANVRAEREHAIAPIPREVSERLRHVGETIGPHARGRIEQLLLRDLVDVVDERRILADPQPEALALHDGRVDRRDLWPAVELLQLEHALRPPRARDRRLELALRVRSAHHLVARAPDDEPPTGDELRAPEERVVQEVPVVDVPTGRPPLLVRSGHVPEQARHVPNRRSRHAEPAAEVEERRKEHLANRLAELGWNLLALVERHAVVCAAERLAQLGLVVGTAQVHPRVRARHMNGQVRVVEANDRAVDKPESLAQRLEPVRAVADPRQALRFAARAVQVETAVSRNREQLAQVIADYTASLASSAPADGGG